MINLNQEQDSLFLETEANFQQQKVIQETTTNVVTIPVTNIKFSKLLGDDNANSVVTNIDTFILFIDSEDTVKIIRDKETKDKFMLNFDLTLMMIKNNTYNLKMITRNCKMSMFKGFIILDQRTDKDLGVLTLFSTLKPVRKTVCIYKLVDSNDVITFFNSRIKKLPVFLKSFELSLMSETNFNAITCKLPEKDWIVSEKQKIELLNKFNSLTKQIRDIENGFELQKLLVEKLSNTVDCYYARSILLSNII